MPSPSFQPATEVRIQAPPAVVFELLCRRSTWNDWNPFVPRADLVRGAPGQDDAQHQDRLQLGQQLRFFVQVEHRGKPRTLPFGQVEEIVRLDTPDPADEHAATWRVDWSQRMLPGFLLRTLRVNEVVRDELDGDRCIYRTYMTFEGLLVGVVKWVAGSMVQHGLERCARGLKNGAERCENQ